MDNNSISEKKRMELTAKLLSGDMTEESLSLFNEEIDKYEAPRAAPASPEMFDGSKPEPEDDTYVPPTSTSIFDEDIVESDDDAPSLDISSLFSSNEPSIDLAASTEDEVEDTDEVTDTDEVDDNETDLEDDVEDDIDEAPASPSRIGEDEEALVTLAKEPELSAKDKVMLWWEDLDPNHQKMFMGVAGAAVLLVITLVALLVFGGDDKEPATPVASNTVTEDVAPVENTPTEGSLIPTSFDVSCPAGASSKPEDAFNPAEDTAWVCERAFGIDGVTLTMTFDTPVEISEVGMVPGFNYTAPRGVDEWNNHRVVTRALWRIGEEQFVQEINPARSDITMSVPNLTVQKIQLTIQATTDPVTATGGNANAVGGADTFAISRIILNGKQSS